MKKRAFYTYLSIKYNLPYKYIKFKIDPYYIYAASEETEKHILIQLEKCFNWEAMQQDYKSDSMKKASIFYID